MMRRHFVAYFYFVGWDCLSIGGHVCWSEPNIEIHLPFGFIRVGWVKSWEGPGIFFNSDECRRRTFGFDREWLAGSLK